MIPKTLTATKAQRLLDKGKARQHGPDVVTTPRATYRWSDVHTCYERDDAALEAVYLYEPRPSASAPVPQPSVPLVRVCGALSGCFRP